MDVKMDVFEAIAIKNSLMSFILGDVMGTPAQFILRANLKESLKQAPISELILNANTTIPFGAWSDDSSMTLCTMKSITDKQTINIENMSEYFLMWLYNAYLTPFDKTFDVGRTTYEALNNFKNNHKMPSGLSNLYSNGNGSLMRILPVSIYCYIKNLSHKETFDIVKNVSSITHAHPISILGCYIYTLVIFDILDKKQKNEIIANLSKIYNSKAIPDDYKEWLNKYDTVLDGSIVTQNADNLDTSGYVKGTLEVALWGFYNTKSVEDCIFRIIELGEDTDTNSAVGAGLSGLYYGLRGKVAPHYWTDKIINKKNVLNIIDEYIEVLR